MIDLIIVAAVFLGAFAGWRRGFIIPLVAATGALVGLYAFYAGPGAGMVPTGTAGIGLGVGLMVIAGTVVGRVGSAIASVVHRSAPLRRVDQGLGIPLGALTALVSVYVPLVALVTFDTFLAPFHGAVTVDAAAVAAVRAAVTANPQFRVLVSPEMLDEMAASVAKTAIPRDQLASFDQALGLYENELRPQLLQSILAPLVLAVGERAPVIGRHVDFPTK